MANYKEIVTKAVIGKSKKNITNEFEFSPSNVPDTILGCWIINHTFSGSLQSGEVQLTGNFDVNVWYSYDNNTKTTVYTQNFSYNDKIKMNDISSYVLEELRNKYDGEYIFDSHTFSAEDDSGLHLSWVEIWVSAVDSLGEDWESTRHYYEDNKDRENNIYYIRIFLNIMTYKNIIRTNVNKWKPEKISIK